MAILSKGTDFTTGDQVTAAKLDALVDNATFASGAVDDSTTQLDGSGRIIVKDGGITTAKLLDGAVTSAKLGDGAVTSAKLGLTDGATIAKSGASEIIASFTTTQGGSTRGFFIQTPDSATDVDSPFVLNTGNAISFEVDNTEVIRLNHKNELIISNIPTNASGLSLGAVYSDNGNLKIVVS